MNRAAVPIPEKLFFKIGEVCDITEVQAHVLRYWESEFPMLAPQKNRAGQRTYRKRDVEMVLRIKELLYEDQYTIAGAKKKLSGELRGASKLKVVTPEMSAQATQQTVESTPHVGPPPASLAQSSPSHQHTSAPFAQPRASHAQTSGASEDAGLALDDDRIAAVRRLRHDLHELLSLLKAGEAQSGLKRK